MRLAVTTAARRIHQQRRATYVCIAPMRGLLPQLSISEFARLVHPAGGITVLLQDQIDGRSVQWRALLADEKKTSPAGFARTRSVSDAVIVRSSSPRADE
jgi:hypothetical protein